MSPDSDNSRSPNDRAPQAFGPVDHRLHPPPADQSSVEQRAAELSQRAESFRGDSRLYEALGALAEEEVLRRALQQRMELVNNLKKQVDLFVRTGQYDLAAERLRQIADEHLKARDHMSSIIALDELARFETTHRDPIRALPIYSQAFGLAREIGWHLAQHTFYMAVANIHYNRGKLHEAMANYIEAENIAINHNLPPAVLASTLKWQSQIHKVRSEFEEALTLQFRIFNLVDQPEAVQRCLLEQAYCHRALSHAESAKEKFSDAELYADQNPSVPKAALAEAIDGQLPYLFAEKKYERALILARRLLKVGEEGNLPASIRRGRYFLASAHRNLGFPERAMAEYQQVEALSGPDSQDSLLSGTLAEEAVLLTYFGLVDAALEKAKGALELSEKMNDGLAGQRLGTIAWIQSQTGKFQSALKTYELQHTRFAAEKSEAGISQSLGSRGRLEFLSCRFDESAQLFEEQLEFARKGNIPLGIAVALDGQTDLKFVRCEFDGLEELFEESARHCREHDLPELLLSALGGLLRLWFVRGTPERVLSLADEVEELYARFVARHEAETDLVHKNLGLADPIQRALGIKVWIEKVRGDVYTALSLALDQEELSRRSGLTFGIVAALANQAALHADLENFTAALECSLQRESLLRKVEFEWGIASVLADLALAHYGLGDKKACLKAADECIEMCRRLGLKFDHINILTNLANWQAGFGNKRKARAAALEAMKLAVAQNWNDRAEYLDNFLRDHQ